MKANESECAENDILITCALRFDGWKYQEATGFDHRKAIDDFFETGSWEIQTLERLCVFFLLQRGLCKWDLVYEPKHGKFWRAFRTLFFLVCREEIPAPYQIADYLEQWRRKYDPNLEQHIGFIREIHETTGYDDNAPPQI